MKLPQILILLVTATLVSSAAITDRPSRSYPRVALLNYEWIHTIKTFQLIVSVSEGAESFMDSNSIENYLKLKMRNFVKEIDLIEPKDGVNGNYLYLDLQLKKYNDKNSIYTGLISLRIDSAVSWKGSSQRYQLIDELSGSDSQILGFIKGNIDLMTEAFAADYYYIEDLKSEHNKAVEEMPSSSAPQHSSP
jgi:hypothetical protein